MEKYKRIDASDIELTERIVYINRVAKVVKGGRRFSFSIIVVVGDGAGHVGVGLGKAKEVPEAIRKAGEAARKNLIKVNLSDDGTFPYEVLGEFGAASVMLKPASGGTGVIAGGACRSILEMAGVKNALTKSFGTNNPHNLVKATLNGLKIFKVPGDIISERKAGVQAAV